MMMDLLLLHKYYVRGETTKKNVVYLKYYWKILFITAIFYVLPSIQFVIAKYDEFLNGEEYCYYNYKCLRPLFGLEAFNNILSNIGYVVLGLIFILYVRSQDKEEELENFEKTTGLHIDMSLYYAIGWSLVLEGIFSALYHVCPTKIMFQFDTTFMIMGAGLLFICIYQKRQPTITSGAFQAYGYFAGIMVLNLLSLLPIPDKAFWILVFLLLTYVSLVTSVYLYYAENLVLQKSRLFPLLRRALTCGPPKDKFRFAFIMLGIIVNYSCTTYFAISELANEKTQDFPSCVLIVMVLDTWIYLFYYILMKYKCNEHVHVSVWISFICMVISGALAMHFYNIAVTNKFLTKEESEALNKPCALFNYFDYHDIWHFLSATAVVLSYFVVYLLDLDRKQILRTEIRVF